MLALEVVHDGISALAATVRELRKDRNLSQEELARRAGLSVTTLSNIENGHRGRVHRGTKAKIANALGVAVTVLDSGELAKDVAAEAITLEQREVIRRVLALPPGDVNELLEAIKLRDAGRGKKR